MNISHGNFDYPGVKDRFYLVIGASGGIGSHCAMLLTRLGARVAINGRNIEKLKEIENKLVGENHIVAPGDLTALDYHTWLSSLIDKADKPLAGIAFCAGVNRPAPLRAFSPQKLLREFNEFTVIAASLFFEFTKLARREEESSLVAMSSVSAALAKTGNALYGAARAALDSLCRSFAIEFAPHKIRCNVVQAGFIKGTGITNRFVHIRGDEYKEKINERYPLGAGTPEDAANALVFLLGTASKWITGTTLMLDGGFRAKGV